MMYTRPKSVAAWSILAIAALQLVAGLAHAQGLDRLDAHNPPDLAQAASDDGGVLGWLEANKTLLLVCFGILGALLVAYWVLNQNTKTKRLQRDALEKLRKSLIESSKATRGPAKSVWLTGSPRDPPARLGRYAGHHRSVDAVWIAYRTWLFGARRLLCTNAADLNGLDAPEIHVRAIGVNVTRGLGYAVPDIHNNAQREDWQPSVRTRLRSPEAFAEAWKAYYAHAVDNAISFYDAMNAAEELPSSRGHAQPRRAHRDDRCARQARPRPRGGHHRWLNPHARSRSSRSS